MIGRRVGFLLRALRLLPHLRRRDEVCGAPALAPGSLPLRAVRARSRASARSRWCSRTSFRTGASWTFMSRRRRVPLPIVWRENVRSTSPHTAILGSSADTVHQGFRCEDLEALTFPDAAFDRGHHSGRVRARLRLPPCISRGDAHGASGWRAHLHHTEVQAAAEDRRTGPFARTAQSCIWSIPSITAIPLTALGRWSPCTMAMTSAEIIWNETRCPTTIYLIREEKTGTIAEFMDVFVTRKV